MESSKNFDLPPVLKPDVEKRLLRVFTHLRQHERKAKLAKKVAELNSLKDHARRAAEVALLSGPGDCTLDAGLSKLQQQEQEGEPSLESVGELVDDSVEKQLELEVEELKSSTSFKESDPSGVISASDVCSAFRALNRPISKAEAQWIVWEVDDDLDGCIDWDEFRGAYARCIVDKHGTEASQFFNLVQFVLSDPDGGGTVSVADIRAELHRIRGTDRLATKIKTCLGATTDRHEQERHSLGHFLEAMQSLPTTFATGCHFPPK